MESNKVPFNRLREIVATLRAPGGCNWDRQQTHKSLLPYLIEEAYEVVEAVEKEDSHTCARNWATFSAR